MTSPTQTVLPVGSRPMTSAITSTILLGTLLAGCSPRIPASLANTSETYTLYRSASVDAQARIHWATFDVDDSAGGQGNYNEVNCTMAADLLNQNLKKLNGGEMPLRFWCERGAPSDVDNKK